MIPEMDMPGYVKCREQISHTQVGDNQWDFKYMEVVSYWYHLRATQIFFCSKNLGLKIDFECSALFLNTGGQKETGCQIVLFIYLFFLKQLLRLRQQRSEHQ